MRRGYDSRSWKKTSTGSFDVSGGRPGFPKSGSGLGWLGMILIAGFGAAGGLEKPALPVLQAAAAQGAAAQGAGNGWLVVALVGVVGVACVIGYYAYKYYRSNLKLRQEITEYQRIETRLRAMELRYRVLVEQAPIPIVVAQQSDHTILYINQRMAEKLGIVPEAAYGKPALNLFVNPIDREQLVAALEAHGFLSGYDALLTTPAGKQFWAGLSATTIAYDEQPAAFYALLDISGRKELENRLETMAIMDDLTSLYNRRYFTLRGAEELEQARRLQLPFSLLILDIDRFKRVNDLYGHEVGDIVLKEFSAVMKRNVRERDIVGRLGGEEFGIFLPNTQPESALQLAERLRATIDRLGLEAQQQTPIRITVSVGAAAFNGNMQNLDDLMRSAGQALLRAKHKGRNRVESAFSVSSPA